MSTLEEYRAKRDFGITSEPEAKLAEAAGDVLSFVVQKHDATRLHYDFRLEYGGVLWSWAVTRGPSHDPSEKRLAVRTEDHPLDYRTFEGTIPKGEYGGGTVMLWDRGWWEPLHDPAKGLVEGKLHFRLHGERMTGGWALVRMRKRGGEKRENWLLIKERDDAAGRGDSLTRKATTSITTGRAMREIAKGTEPESKAPKAHDKPRPRFRKPQLATLRDAPPEGEDWRHEAKFDGYRAMIAIGKGGIRLYSRSGLDWSDKFGALCDPAAAIPCKAALIDGEAVAGASGGDFSALQQALKSGGPLTFYAFDLLHLDGRDLTREPLTKRRAALERLLKQLPERGAIRLSPFIEGSGADVLAAICNAGGEGIISKRADALYRAGRSHDWIKAKCGKRAEFVVVGWSPSDKAGRPFASLLLASYEAGELVYRGRVGSGFDEDDFDRLAPHLTRLARNSPPLGGELPDETRDARWLKPELVAEVSYAEFTGEGRVRHGVFRGLRIDKEAKTVTAKAETEVEGLTFAGIRITHPARVVYPSAKLTKGDVARHYDLVADRFLAHAADRPVALLRCPAGTDKECFFQKHAGKGFPDEIDSVPITESDGDEADYMVIRDRAGLMAAVQMGAIEFHIWGARRDRLERPDRLVFDLDPDEGLGFAEVKSAASDLRAILGEVGLEAGAMVTGGKGVHVIVPLRRTAEWPTVKTFAQTLAHALAEREPKRFTATMSKAKRKGRIFIDWLRNERGATAIAPYALRARTGAPVAVPVAWDELARLRAPNLFHPAEMKDRLASPCPFDGIPARSIGHETAQALGTWAAGG